MGNAEDLNQPTASPKIGEVGQVPMYHPEDDPSREIKEIKMMAAGKSGIVLGVGSLKPEVSAEPPTTPKPPEGPDTPS